MRQSWPDLWRHLDQRADNSLAFVQRPAREDLALRPERQVYATTPAFAQHVVAVGVELPEVLAALLETVGAARCVHAVPQERGGNIGDGPTGHLDLQPHAPIDGERKIVAVGAD